VKLALIVLSVIAFSAMMASQNAEAQVVAGEAFLLSGSGYSITPTSITDATIELLFTTARQGNSVTLDLSRGSIVFDEKELKISDFTSTALRNGQIIIITSKASDLGGEQYTFRASARIVAKAAGDSVYTLTGAITDSSQKTSRVFYTVLVSEFADQAPQTAQKEITIRFLKGASSPGEITYKEQIGGARFQFLSEPRITIEPGTTITFLNEDIVSHSLKSGTGEYKANKRTFTPDGKISSGEIPPGQSWSITFDTQGFYRLFDEKYPWIDTSVFVIDKAKQEASKLG